MPEAPLAWQGGKTRLADEIIKLFRPHVTYVEGCFGQGSVFFTKPRSTNEVINDVDGDVTNFFKVIRDRPAELATALYLTPYSRDEYAAVCAARGGDDDVERARCFAYRVAGSIEHGSDAKPYNWARVKIGVPSQVNKWVALPDVIAALAARLRGVTIENRDLLVLLKEFDSPQTLFYLDPPYYNMTRREKSGRSYAHEMSDGAHRRLLELIVSLEGQVILSGYPSVLYDDRLASWTRHDFVQKLSAPRGGQGTIRDVTECVWVNRGSPKKTSLGAFA